MRVLVVGAGAVGSWVGGLLAAGGADVTLVARGEHGKAMRNQGLTLVGTGRRAFKLYVQPGVIETVAEVSGSARSGPTGQNGQTDKIEPFDFVLVAVKSYDTESVAMELAALEPKLESRPRALVCLQNGIGNEDLLARHLPTWPVIAATLTTGIGIDTPGTVIGKAAGGVGIAQVLWKEHGEPGEVTSDATAQSVARAVAELAEALASSGQTEVRIYPDAGDALKWSKLLLNLLGGASCAILGYEPAQVFADRALYRLELAAWLEALAVIRAKELRPVSLPGYPINLFGHAVVFLPEPLLYHLTWRKLGTGRANRLPGVAADLAAGRTRSEVAVLNGAVVKAGLEVGVPTPVNGVLTRLVLDLAEGRRAREEFAGRPDELMWAVEEYIG